MPLVPENTTKIVIRIIKIFKIIKIRTKSDGETFGLGGAGQKAGGAWQPTYAEMRQPEKAEDQRLQMMHSRRML